VSILSRVLSRGAFLVWAVFYLTYLRSELVRRKGRTILTVLGLALGVALVVAISALSRGLDRTQERVLDPLSTIGTDLTVTRGVEEQSGAPASGSAAAGS